ncbi:MAG: hypothetical protein ACP5OP_01605, partial [Leptospirillia bacterium]
GGYGGGVTATHWITSNFGLQASIEIESFGFNPTSSTLAHLINPASGTPIIPITMGAIYDITGGRNWINPQVFADFGPAVSLYGQSVPVYFDAGAGITTPLAKLSDTLAGIDLFANIRVAYLDQTSGALSGNLGSTQAITVRRCSTCPSSLAPPSSSRSTLSREGRDPAPLSFL